MEIIIDPVLLSFVLHDLNGPYMYKHVLGEATDKICEHCKKPKAVLVRQISRMSSMEDFFRPSNVCLGCLRTKLLYNYKKPEENAQEIMQFLNIVEWNKKSLIF